MFAELLGATVAEPISTLETELVAARAARGAADATLADAQRLTDDAAASADRAEAVYDAGPDGDAAASVVLVARNARDLTIIRRDRAAKRAEAARAALDGAEFALAKSRAVAKLDGLDGAVFRDGAAVLEGRRHRAALRPAEALARVVDFTGQSAQRLGAEVDTALETQAARIVDLEAAELELLELAPELADTIAATRSARDDARREELLEAAGVATFRATIADDVAIVVLAERLIDASKARITGARDAQITAATRARDAGLDAPDLHEKHLEIHTIAARASTPEELRRAAYAVRDLSGGVGYLGYQPAKPNAASIAAEEILDLYLGAARARDAARAAVRLMHLRALRAGDVNARLYENGLGGGRDEETAAAFAEGTPIAEAEGAEAARRFAEQQEQANRGRSPHQRTANNLGLLS